ncbi:alpha/beta hydrolase [Microbacterium gorillae]|uniref:alpha/beta hydrolase n=1 Tax=Microbacterium gorillae TaxID=1231063 RepID=UPI00058D0564|nr:alpha/beta hydrolase [Microbacterium gorillae]
MVEARVQAALGEAYDFATETTLEGIRAGYDRCMGKGTLPPGVTRSDGEVGGVPGAWFTPEGAEDVTLFLHGGGYFAGSSVSHGDLAAAIAAVSNSKVFAADYGLAPERPHPAAVEDALAAYEALRADATGRVFIVGDSAGGGLAVSTLVAARDKGVAQPNAAALMSPWADLTLTNDDIDTNAAIDPVVTRGGLEFNVSLYAPDQDVKNPLISPVYADLSGLPPLYVQVGTEEVLQQDALTIVENARAAGVDVTLDIEEGMPHVHQILLWALPEAEDAVRRIGEFLAAH